MTQESRILAYLKAGKTLTPLEALRLFGCFRLSGRVYDLKDDGYDIRSRLVRRNGKTFAEYWMTVKGRQKRANAA